MAIPLPIFLHLTSIFEHERGKEKGGRGGVARLSWGQVAEWGGEGGCDTGWPHGRAEMFCIGLISG